MENGVRAAARTPFLFSTFFVFSALLYVTDFSALAPACVAACARFSR